MKKNIVHKALSLVAFTVLAQNALAQADESDVLAARRIFETAQASFDPAETHGKWKCGRYSLSTDKPEASYQMELGPDASPLRAALTVKLKTENSSEWMTARFFAEDEALRYRGKVTQVDRDVCTKYRSTGSSYDRYRNERYTSISCVEWKYLEYRQGDGFELRRISKDRMAMEAAVVEFKSTLPPDTVYGIYSSWEVTGYYDSNDLSPTVLGSGLFGYNRIPRLESEVTSVLRPQGFAGKQDPSAVAVDYYVCERSDG